MKTFNKITLVLLIVIATLSSCKRDNPKTVIVYRAYTHKGDIVPVYITGPDTFVFHPTDTVPINKVYYIDPYVEEPFDIVVLGPVIGRIVVQDDVN